eukprot:1461504-Prymnesium_polylepis.1
MQCAADWPSISERAGAPHVADDAAPRGRRIHRVEAVSGDQHRGRAQFAPGWGDGVGHVRRKPRR